MGVQGERTYEYSEDDLVVFSVDMCEECADEILPVFFDAIGYGCDEELLEWPETANRAYSEPASSTLKTD
jgi:hypothetical protein